MRITLGNSATGQVAVLADADTILIEVDEAGEHMGQLNIRQVGGTLVIHGNPAVCVETSPTATPGIELDGGFWGGNPEQIRKWHAERIAAEQRAAAEQPATHLTGDFNS